MNLKSSFWCKHSYQSGDFTEWEEGGKNGGGEGVMERGSDGEREV